MNRTPRSRQTTGHQTVRSKRAGPAHERRRGRASPLIRLKTPAVRERWIAFENASFVLADAGKCLGVTLPTADNGIQHPNRFDHVTLTSLDSLRPDFPGNALGPQRFEREPPETGRGENHCATVAKKAAGDCDLLAK